MGLGCGRRGDGVTGGCGGGGGTGGDDYEGEEVEGQEMVEVRPSIKLAMTSGLTRKKAVVLLRWRL